MVPLLVPKFRDGIGKKRDFLSSLQMTLPRLVCGVLFGKQDPVGFATYGNDQQ